MRALARRDGISSLGALTPRIPLRRCAIPDAWASGASGHCSPGLAHQRLLRVLGERARRTVRHANYVPSIPAAY